MRLITALVAAAFFARVLARRLCPRADLKLDPLGKDSARLIDLIFMLAIPAVLIGWQTMPAVIVAATLLSVLIRPLVNWIPINDGPKGQIESRGALEYFAFALPIVLTVQLAWWRPLWASGFWPSDVSLPWVILIWAAGTLIVPSHWSRKTRKIRAFHGRSYRQTMMTSKTKLKTAKKPIITKRTIANRAAATKNRHQPTNCQINRAMPNPITEIRVEITPHVLSVCASLIWK